MTRPDTLIIAGAPASLQSELQLNIHDFWTDLCQSNLTVNQQSIQSNRTRNLVQKNPFQVRNIKIPHEVITSFNVYKKKGYK